MEPTFKRSLRWTLIMAILGFILGLGFLIPLSPQEARAPASGGEPAITFLEPSWSRSARPIARPNDPSGSRTVTDARTDLLFDIHVNSRSALAKGTDAYVTTEFKWGGREEISEFSYCHNYDYKKLRARTELNRYSTGNDGFDCYPLSLDELANEYVLIETPLGNLLSLKSQPGFDPRKGGTISVLFAYHVAKFGRNDYRRLDLHVTLVNGKIQITGPKGEAFNWLNLTLSEDLFNLPNGVNAFDLYLNSSKTSNYAGKEFPKFTPAAPRK